MEVLMSTVCATKKDYAPSDYLYDKLYNVLNYRFISGKYFTGGKEVNEIEFNKYIKTEANAERLKASPSLIDDVKKLFVMYADVGEL